MSDSAAGGPAIRRKAWFWREDPPLEVRFAVERATRMLLGPEAADDGSLIYAGTASSFDPVFRGRLRLEAVEPGRALYSLEMEARATGPVVTPEKLPERAERLWQFWIGPLATVATPPAATDHPALYRRTVEETRAREAELARQEEDQAPVQAARAAVVAGLRQGKRCVESDKEGITTFRFDGRQFTRKHIGDWDEDRVFDGPDAILADLRNFYDWRVRRDYYPHRPPELEAWKLILSRLE